jgi:alkylated DNA repair dioxygenase AlkB
MEQVIASLSLGARRTFVMHPHVSKGEQKIAAAEVKRWVLGNGSLVVMQGETQENWKVRSVLMPLWIYFY